MDDMQMKLCDIQGRLFELSATRRLDSASFIKKFMLSETAKALDSSYNRMQWAGEEYLLEEVLFPFSPFSPFSPSFPVSSIPSDTIISQDKIGDEDGNDGDDGNDKKSREIEIYSKDILYWIGYIYRFWHYYTGESSEKIYRQASASTMKRNYMMFHTMTPALAVDDLKEVFEQNRRKRRQKQKKQ